MCCFVQGPRRNRGYEGLDRADMESLQLPPPPHHYAGLDTQAPGVGLDQHGYIVVIPDPEDEHHSRVSLPVLSAAVRKLTEMLK